MAKKDTPVVTRPVEKVLISGIGHNDLQTFKALTAPDSQTKSRGGFGPLCEVVARNSDYHFKHVYVLGNKPLEKVNGCKISDYIQWLFSQAKANGKDTLIYCDEHTHKDLYIKDESFDPTNMPVVFKIQKNIIAYVLKEHPAAQIYLQVASGSPQMQMGWFLNGLKHKDIKFLYTSYTKIDGDFKQITKEVTLPEGYQFADIAHGVENRMSSKPNATGETTFDSIIGNDEKLVNCKIIAGHFARFDSSTLIYGETGTGKELFAQSMHKASVRSEANFVGINCGAIPSELLESELFGHEKGAFTSASDQKKGMMELAHGGTLFLDEIGELPLLQQVKLLRALETRTIRRIGGTTDILVDFKLIAATHKNLQEEVAAGRFREDLFYRIRTFILQIPPLRDRGDDIKILAESFLVEIKDRYNIETSFVEEALNRLCQHTWPGNVRELYSTVTSLACMSSINSRTEITAADVDNSIIKLENRSVNIPDNVEPLSFEWLLFCMNAYAESNKDVKDKWYGAGIKLDEQYDKIVKKLYKITKDELFFEHKNSSSKNEEPKGALKRPVLKLLGDRQHDVTTRSSVFVANRGIIIKPENEEYQIRDGVGLFSSMVEKSKDRENVETEETEAAE